MEIITLQEYTDQYVSLYEGEIRNLPNDLALRLINKGVAAQHDKDILNSTTSDDDGKVLTVVNGKPTFSAPATVNDGNSTMNYVVYYSRQEEIQASPSRTANENTIFVNFLYKDKQFTTYLMPEEAVQSFEERDFIIIKHGYFYYDQPIWANAFVISYGVDENNHINYQGWQGGTSIQFYPYFESTSSTQTK